MYTPGEHTSNSDTAIIIPAYNPATELLTICNELLQLGFSVFVVNDGSVQTQVFNAIEELPVTVLHHSVNMGQGAAIETGISKALSGGKEFFVTFDADGQHSALSVTDLQNQLFKSKADIVFGSRFLNKEFSGAVPAGKRFTLRVAAFFDALITGIRLTDSHNGLRIFNRAVAASLHFKENRMAHATEILWLVKKYQWKYDECPVLISYNSRSQHPLRSIEIAMDIFLRKLIS